LSPVTALVIESVIESVLEGVPGIMELIVLLTSLTAFAAASVSVTVETLSLIAS